MRKVNVRLVTQKMMMISVQEVLYFRYMKNLGIFSLFNKICSGSPNFNYWCNCNKNCFKNWSKEYIYHLGIQFSSFSTSQQKVFINEYTVFKSGRHVFQLPCHPTRVQVCCSFFKRVLGIGSVKLNNILKLNTLSFVEIPRRTGKWNRGQKEFKGKIIDSIWMDWIQVQPKTLSHFTRDQRRQQLWYFTDCNSFRELYRQYIEFMKEHRHQTMSMTTFFYKFKKKFPNYKFQRPILDACSTCLHLNNLMKKTSRNEDKIFVMKILHKHQKEADNRYEYWRKNRGKVKHPLSEIEIEVIHQSE